MSESEFHPEHQLPAELEVALKHASTRTFTSLVALRKALRDHVRTQRQNGLSFGEIESGLRVLMTRTEGTSPRSPGEQRRAGSLADQVVKWSEGFFAQTD